MGPRRKAVPTHPQLDFTPRTPQRGDLVQRKGSPSTYQIFHIPYDGKTVTLCLMHGGSLTNFELRNIPVENLVWLDQAVVKRSITADNQT
jgi:hypothetical protein